MVLSLIPRPRHAFLAPDRVPGVDVGESRERLDAGVVLKPSQHFKAAQTSPKSRDVSVTGQSVEARLEGANSSRAGSSFHSEDCALIAAQFVLFCRARPLGRSHQSEARNRIV